MEKSYTYVMSDIHGEYDAFVKMLDRIKFNDKDKLYVIGDVLDRGPKPIKTLMHIMCSNNITMLAGNHEHMAILCLRVLIEDLTDEVFAKISDKFIESLEDWKMNGGGTTIKDLFDYSKEDRKRVLDFLMKLKLYKELTVEDKKYILVHAGLGNFNKNKRLKEYNIMELVWDRMDYEKTYFNDKYLVVGHTPTQLIENNKKPGYIYINNNNIAIDCGCTFKDGRLGCLRLDDMKEYYIWQWGLKYEQKPHEASVYVQ